MCFIRSKVNLRQIWLKRLVHTSADDFGVRILYIDKKVLSPSLMSNIGDEIEA